MLIYVNLINVKLSELNTVVCPIMNSITHFMPYTVGHTTALSMLHFHQCNPVTKKAKCNKAIAKATNYQATISTTLTKLVKYQAVSHVKPFNKLYEYGIPWEYQ